MFNHAMFNHSLPVTERVVEEHMKDVAREVEQTRPVEGLEDLLNMRGWAHPVGMILGGLLSLLIRVKS